LEKLGGAEGLAGKLCSSFSRGISTGKVDALVERRHAFGENRFKTVKMKAFWTLVYENLQDPTLILLMAAALVGRPHLTIGAGRKDESCELVLSEDSYIFQMN
jgi:hypothetical protein